MLACRLRPEAIHISTAVSFLFLWTAFSLSLPLSSSASSQPGAEKALEANMTILYDNNRFDRRLKAEWGFSCLVRGFEKTILFDTGGDGSTLLENMRRLGVEPAEIDIVVLSHIHGDHTGGLEGFLERNSRVVVYLPGSFPENFKKAVKSLGGRVEEVVEAKELFPGAYTTGELGDAIREQALALKTTEGLVVITGCAHPGIVNTIRKAREITDEKKVYLVIGGFHLASESASRLKSILKEFRRLSVHKVAPCHCTGEGARRLFKQEYGADYIECGVGKRITLPKLESLKTNTLPPSIKIEPSIR
jgi:7,8-dihydropterin-6-yl-methyl-4-(beta-D-ribofuranosyl)aminobenzene 5'-phosphate synthase